MTVEKMLVHDIGFRLRKKDGLVQKGIKVRKGVSPVIISLTVERFVALVDINFLSIQNIFRSYVLISHKLVQEFS